MPRAMKTTVFSVQKMDCPTEEQLVQLKLATVAGVDAAVVDLDERTVTVYHDANPDDVLGVLHELQLDATMLAADTGMPSPASSESDGRQRRVLVIALVINAVLFVAEFAAGIVSNSMGLLADSIDMLADASVYGLSIIAVGGTMVRKKRLAATSGYLQLALAVVGLVEVVRRFFGDESLPDARIMIFVSLIALAGNIATLLILKRAKSPEAHFQASWIFTA
ncbi:MAG: cation transporter, partial [Actinomycetia bacterium]|nr:cation transporter [Actinomycetes bacterium]